MFDETKLPPGVLRSNIPLQLAHQAHSGTSFVPEKRAVQEQDGYLELMVSDYANLKEAVQNEAEQQLLDEEFARYAQAYAAKCRVHLVAKSRCLSWMITGPARFPSARNEKRNNTERKRSEEASEFRKRAMAAIRKKIRPENGIISSSDPDAIEHLKAKLAGLRAEHEKAKKANAIIRKHKGTAAAIPALLELGYSEKVAALLLVPDFCGRIGHPDYSMANRNANMKRIEARIAEVSKMQASEAKEVQYEGGITLAECPEDGRIRLYFPGKPERAVIDKLKSGGWRWSPTAGAWQRHLNANGRYAAKWILESLGVKKEVTDAAV